MSDCDSSYWAGAGIGTVATAVALTVFGLDVFVVAGAVIAGLLCVAYALLSKQAEEPDGHGPEGL